MGYLTEINNYIKEKIRPKAPTLGLWFYQAHWLNNDLHFIDALIKEVEAQGANVIPVFHHRYKDKDRGNQGADHVDHLTPAYRQTSFLRAGTFIRWIPSRSPQGRLGNGDGPWGKPSWTATLRTEDLSWIELHLLSEGTTGKMHLLTMK